MLKLIASIFQYSFLVLVILVLSHVIQIKGVTISDHVLNGMNAVTGFSPGKQLNEITQNYSHSLKNRLEQIGQAEAEITPEEKRSLDQVIERSQRKK